MFFNIFNRRVRCKVGKVEKEGLFFLAFDKGQSSISLVINAKLFFPNQMHFGWMYIIAADVIVT